LITGNPQVRIKGVSFTGLAVAGALTAMLGAAACGAGGSSAGQSTQPAAVSPASDVSISQFATANQVKAAVAAAEPLSQLPSRDVPQLEALASGKLNYGYEGDNVTSLCPGPSTFESKTDVSSCVFGDKTAKKTMVLLGDSRAQMWFQTFDQIATASRWRLVVLAKVACPAAVGSFRLIDNGVPTRTPFPACDNWHKFVISAVRAMKPQLIVDSSAPNLFLTNDQYAAPPSQAKTAISKFLDALPPSAKKVVLGGFPNPSPSPDLCLSKNPNAIQQCAFQPTAHQLALNEAAQLAASKAGAGYISEQPWLCAAKCPAVIAGIVAYTIDGFHIQSNYATYLTGALWAALRPYLG
jgi:hypothetical protein